MTSNREEYLRIIYQAGGLHEYVSNKVLSEKLDIAMPSIIEVINKLDKEGYINYKKYKGSMLTQKGLNASVNVVRSHRIWEVFLIKHLNYSWREAHEDAHLLEHATSERMLDRLDEFLNYPEVCPHGAKIPRIGDCELPVRNLKPLNSIEVGGKVKISRLVEDGILLDYISKCGIKVGEEAEILSKGEYEGEIVILQEGMEKRISHKAASQIFVD